VLISRKCLEARGQFGNNKLAGDEQGMSEDKKDKAKRNSFNELSNPPAAASADCRLDSGSCFF
jgi:hypothetical protein